MSVYTGGVSTLVECLHWWSVYAGGVCGVCTLVEYVSVYTGGVCGVSTLVECVRWWSVWSVYVGECVPRSCYANQCSQSPYK